MFFNIFDQKSNFKKIINKSVFFFHLNSLCTEYPRESLPAHSTLKDFSTGWWIMRDALASECIINVNHRFSARIKDLFPVRWQLEERSTKQSVHRACTYAVRFTGIADSTFWWAVKRVREWLMLLLHRQSLLGLRWVKVRTFGGGGFFTGSTTFRSGTPEPKFLIEWLNSTKVFLRFAQLLLQGSAG